MDKIIMLDDMAYTRYRVKQLLYEEGIEVYEASTSAAFFNKLYEKKDEINLIILEVGLSSEDGFEVLKKIRERELKIPIMILTKMNTRTDFIKCIKEGTIEYILKPFDNKMLVERVNKLIKCYKVDEKPEEIIVEEPEEIIYLNFQEYMIKQISKAKEQETKVSFMMASLIKANATSEGEKIDVKDAYLILTDLLYEGLKELFKAPDLFVKYGFSTFIGILPKYDNDSITKIEESIQEKYKKIKVSDERYNDYSIECVFVTYPEDGHEKQELLDNLMARMKEKIDNSIN
jgi:DNA-binding response OmpR family regulator